MKNITVSVDEETHRLARIRAAELDTSVSALVREYLKSLVANRTGGTAVQRARRGDGSVVAAVGGCCDEVFAGFRCPRRRPADVR